MSQFSRQLNLDAITLLADIWDNDLDPEVSAQLVYLSFGKENGKGKGKVKGKGKGKFNVRQSRLSLEGRRQRLKELKAKKTNVELVVERDTGQTIANAQCLHPARLHKNQTRTARMSTRQHLTTQA